MQVKLAKQTVVHETEPKMAVFKGSDGLTHLQPIESNEIFAIIQFQMENTNRPPRINWTLQRIESVLWKLDGTGVEIFDTCVCSVTGKILNRWWLRERPIRVFPVIKGFLVS